jgi:pimeloyl-ACP methyl ester carboxylesterase
VSTTTQTEERFADVGRGIELCHQTVGDPDDEPMLLIQGIGTQMIGWPDGFCELLAERGFHVIRFDNRDSGRSTWLTELGTPSVNKAWAKKLDHSPYLFTDMADDTAGLLDAFGLEAAHVVGASLGGFIAQTLAIEHPERVLSLASMMSSTGSGEVGQPTPAALEALMTRPPDDRDGYVETIVAIRKVIGSTGFDQDEDWIRETAGRAYDRGVNPDGTQRQLVASICSGSRHARLGDIEAPTVVLHGAADQLIDPSGGRATAEAIPGAELVIVEGWGHDLPPGVWEVAARAITSNAKQAQEVRA